MLLFFSRIAAKKGLAPLVESLPPLLARWPRLKLLLAGADDGLGTELRRKAATLGVADAMVFTGHLDGEDVGSALAAADLFVLPSRSENFGIAAVEAAGFGVPALLSPGVAVAAELSAAGAAALAEPAPEALSAAIAALLADEGARRALAERGRDFVPRRYGWPAAAARLAEAYRAVLAA